MRATSPPPHPSLPYWPFIDGKNQLRINTAAINQFNRSLYKMAYYQRSADRQLCGCWHRNCVDSGKENRMRGVEGPSLDFHIFRALQETRCFHFISGVPPNWRTARCCRPRNISFVRRKWKLKIESYIQHTHTHTHTVDCAAHPERCRTTLCSPCTRSSRSTSFTIYCTEFMKCTSFILII